MKPDDPEALPPDAESSAEGVVPGRGALNMPHPKIKRPPPSAYCPVCNHANLSSLPTFSAGSGVAARPFAEDIVCHDCGYIGMPALTGR